MRRQESQRSVRQYDFRFQLISAQMRSAAEHLGAACNSGMILATTYSISKVEAHIYITIYIIIDHPFWKSPSLFVIVKPPELCRSFLRAAACCKSLASSHCSFKLRSTQTCWKQTVFFLQGLRASGRWVFVLVGGPKRCNWLYRNFAAV